MFYTTETGRLRIQRQAWRLTSAANVYDFGHVALFLRRKKVNASGHIPVRDLTMAYSVNSKRRTLIRGKSIHESFRGSILESIIAGCKRKLSVEVFGASTKMVDSETPKCEQ